MKVNVFRKSDKLVDYMRCSKRRPRRSRERRCQIAFIESHYDNCVIRAAVSRATDAKVHRLETNLFFLGNTRCAPAADSVRPINHCDKCGAVRKKRSSARSASCRVGAPRYKSQLLTACARSANKIRLHKLRQTVNRVTRRSQNRHHHK